MRISVPDADLAMAQVAALIIDRCNNRDPQDLKVNKTDHTGVILERYMPGMNDLGHYISMRNLTHMLLSFVDDHVARGSLGAVPESVKQIIKDALSVFKVWEDQYRLSGAMSPTRWTMHHEALTPAPVA